MKNCAEYHEVLFACWHAGLVAVPMNAKLHSKESRTSWKTRRQGLLRHA